MKKKYVILKRGLFITIIAFLCVGYYLFKTDKISASTIVKKGAFSITAENKWDSKSSYASLNWTDIPNLSQSGYQLFGMDDLSKEWVKQSINYGKNIKILNVYPNISGSKTLSSWMKGLNLKDKNGKELMEVREVSISSFNTSASSILKDSSGNYYYDVIMFGSWDSNNSLDISATAYNEVKAFSDYGRGVLFGHDTIYEKANF